MFGSAFSSPVIKTINGKKQIVVQTRTDLAGVNPKMEMSSGNETMVKSISWNEHPNTKRFLIIRFSPVAMGEDPYCLPKADGKQTIKQAWENKQEGYMSGPIILMASATFIFENKELPAST